MKLKFETFGSNVIDLPPTLESWTLVKDGAKLEFFFVAN